MNNPVLIMIGMAVVVTAILAIGQSLYWAWMVRREADQRELARRLGTMAEEQYQSLFRDHAADAAAPALGDFGSHLQETLDQADSQMMVGSLLEYPRGHGQGPEQGPQCRRSPKLQRI